MIVHMTCIISWSSLLQTVLAVPVQFQSLHVMYPYEHCLCLIGCLRSACRLWSSGEIWVSLRVIQRCAICLTDHIPGGIVWMWSVCKKYLTLWDASLWIFWEHPRFHTTSVLKNLVIDDGAIWKMMMMWSPAHRFQAAEDLSATALVIFLGYWCLWMSKHSGGLLTLPAICSS